MIWYLNSDLRFAHNSHLRKWDSLAEEECLPFSKVSYSTMRHVNRSLVRRDDISTLLCTIGGKNYIQGETFGLKTSTCLLVSTI